MGNLFLLHILKPPCISRLTICGSRKVLLKVVKMDGEVLEFTAPVLVKELLMNFEGFVVKSSRKSINHLPLSSQLQLGKIYYLLPCCETKKMEATSVSVRVEPEANTAVKRIKVVITKKQLQELLSKKTSVEKIILGVDKACSVSSATNWKPSLTSIPEEDEFDAMKNIN